MRAPAQPILRTMGQRGGRNTLLVVVLATALAFWLLASVYGLIALGASFAASACCLRAARRSGGRTERGPNRPLSRVGLVVGAVVMSPAFLFAALVTKPAPVETLTLRQAGIGSYLTNDAGERISGNRYTQILRVGESARCHVRRLPLMPAVIESCTPA
jgi:hypothetical protein